MGCDIHMWAEKKVDGKWTKIGDVFKNPYFKPGSGYEWNTEYTDHPYDGRNYDLFAILANVRNGHGFAGIKTGEGFNPISGPRGIPDDADQATIERLESYGFDGHSHSYFTVQELLDYDWNQLTVNQGWVDRNGYKEYLENGAPDRYCGDVFGGLIRKIPNEAMAEVAEDDHRTYTLVKWGTTYRDAVGNYWFETVLPALLEQGSADEVRILFFFDN